ncbi:MAG: hypothetical protein DRJ51_02995 [Thermoprotei archaeon]|nr:MAG: hypothetical protein DRJ51_02995 [Thermoprotei archaeon]
MPPKRLGHICLMIAIVLLLMPKMPQTVVSGGLGSGGLENVEFIYNPNPPPIILPIERWGKYGIIVRNRGSTPISLRYDVFSIYDGKEVGISPFPQPGMICLQPGENQTIWYFLDVSYRTGLTPESAEVEGEHHVRVKVVVEDAENPQDRKEFYINHTIKIVPPDKYEPNALIEGYVIDAESGKPIPNIEVRFEGAQGILRYQTITDEKGYYSIRFYAHRYSDTGAYHGYCLVVETFRKALFPKPGERIFYNVTLPPPPRRLEVKYKLIAKYSTGYPIWLADLDKKERYIVFASGHHTIKDVDPSKHGIYFFDTKGNLLWRYPTEYQVWGVDISDDGEYVAAAFLTIEKIVLFHRNGTILWDTEKLGYERFESREVKISHNNKYVAIGTTFGDLLLLDLKTGNLVWKVFLRGQVRYITFTADDSIIYASSGDGYVYKISVATGEILGRVYVEAWTPRYSFTFSEDGRYLATISKAGRICLVDTETMKVLWSFDTRGGGHWTAITPDNSVVLAGSGGSYGLIAFDFKGNVLWLVPEVTGTRAFILNGKYIIIDNRIFDFRGNILHEFREIPRNVDFIYVTKDSSKIIAIDGNGTLYILEGEIREHEFEEKPPEKPPEEEKAPPITLINLEEVPEVKRSFEEALKGRFGGGGSESLNFKAMVELGVTWKRVGFCLLDLNFTIMDNQVMACQKAGMILLIILDIPDPGMPPEEFARRAAMIVERYDGDGVDDMPGLKFPVLYYEIMNEISDRREWTLELYKEYYLKAYEAIKKACSKCKVAPSSFVGPDERYLRFLKESRLKFDFLSYHSYTDYLDVDKLMEILKKLGFEKVEVWVTESQFGGLERRLERSEKEIAEALVKSYAYALARGITKVSPSELEAREHFPEGLRHSCLIDERGRKKPAFYAYKTLIRMVNGFAEARVLSTNPYVVEFTLANGTKIYVAWGRGRVPLKGKAKVVNTYGDKEEIVEDISKFELRDKPVYIKILKAEEKKEEEKVTAPEQQLNLELYIGLAVLVAVIIAIVIVVLKRRGSGALK